MLAPALAGDDSGVVVTSGVDMDFEDETENRVTLMVHNIRPPFLDGRVVFTTQMQIVSTVRISMFHLPPPPKVEDAVFVRTHPCGEQPLPSGLVGRM